MTMSEKLQYLESLINTSIDLNTADGLSLYLDWEYGWMCGFTKGSNQFVAFVSGWSRNPSDAVDELFEKVKVVS